jgi:acid phosphatase family membrane protein YuiD
VNALREWFAPAIAWNPPLALALLAMMSAQAFKFLRSFFRRNRPDFTRLIGTGGMPSAHSASVTALAVGVGLSEGWGSAVFGLAAFFALLTMYDATGIRRAAGRQARILNQLAEGLREHHKLDLERLAELLGHTPLEVVVGALYGAVLAFALHP